MSPLSFLMHAVNTESHVTHLIEYFAIPYLVAFGVKPLGLCLALQSSRVGFNANLINGYMQHGSGNSLFSNMALGI